MIIDRVEYCNSYPYGSAWNTVFTFLSTITPNAKKCKKVYARLLHRGKKLNKTIEMIETVLQ
jgi:hypothetical protein